MKNGNENIVQTLEKLRRTELLLEISRKIAGLKSLEEILWTLIEFVTNELDADRGTLFLNDNETNELYSRVAQGDLTREIRILNNVGIAGAIFQNKSGEVIHDVYADSRFNKEVDQETGYKTKNMICCPVKTVDGLTIGVIQVLNKKKVDLQKIIFFLLSQLPPKLLYQFKMHKIQNILKKRNKEMEFISIVSDVTAEIDLGALLQRVMEEATRMLNADRATLFLNDEKTNELFSRVAMGKALVR